MLVVCCGTTFFECGGDESISVYVEEVVVVAVVLMVFLFAITVHHGNVGDSAGGDNVQGLRSC